MIYCYLFIIYIYIIFIIYDIHKLALLAFFNKFMTSLFLLIYKKKNQLSFPLAETTGASLKFAAFCIKLQHPSHTSG